MEYRVLGESGIKMSAIAFGAWAIGGWMWGGADSRDAVKAIHKAYDLGITTIDTAPAYGFGLSEEIVGKAVKGKRDRFQILTKYGLRWDVQKGIFHFDTKDEKGEPVKMYKYAGREGVFEECEQSLKRLRTDCIDLYQIHWPDDSTPIEETMEAVQKLMEQGKVRAAGVCNYSVQQMEKAEKTLPLASNQIPFSMVNRGADKDVIPHCKRLGKGILAYSPLQRGILTGKIKPGHRFNPGDHRPDTPFFQPENHNKIMSFLEAVRPIVDAHRCTLAQLVISWTIHRPGVTIALVGARNPAQVEENAGAGAVVLSGEELSSIDKLIEGLNLT